MSIFNGLNFTKTIAAACIAFFVAILVFLMAEKGCGESHGFTAAITGALFGACEVIAHRAGTNDWSKSILGSLIIVAGMGAIGGLVMFLM
jgi:hypothetical protein